MTDAGLKRVIIENVQPEIDGGRFPIKRVVGEQISIQADVFGDGHDEVTAQLLYRPVTEENWKRVSMRPLGNDRWISEFTVTQKGLYYYTIEGWVDHFTTWQKDLQKKYDANQDITVDLQIGVELIKTTADRALEEISDKLKLWSEQISKEKDPDTAFEYAMDKDLSRFIRIFPDKNLIKRFSKVLTVWVDRKEALFSAWYEFFPRSTSTREGAHGTFKDCERILPKIVDMGFDVIYFPPIHPIGRTHRKGKNNTRVAQKRDPGVPWAIGSKQGGHKSIHPELGTMQDFKRLIKKVKAYGIELALDLAFQCSPDHPYVKKHPEWFKWRPDGQVQFAENPPKKYEDVLPINFETNNWRELWDELLSVVLFWVEKGVKIFRVDNPHTKPFVFWEWLIREVKKVQPDVLFLSEAFTRPKVMYRLAKIGFTQSYTYFTWRNTKQEFTDYLTELTKTEVKEYFRPNFWPNTPDIFPQHLQIGGRASFMIRLVLATTLSSNYGIYGPVFELCVQDALPGREEYLDSEKYEIRHWNRNQDGNISTFIKQVNRIRKENTALQNTNTIRFHAVDNPNLICYDKISDDKENHLLVVVNLDPHYRQSGWVDLPLEDLHIPVDQPFMVHDLFTDEKYIWQGPRNYIELDPQKLPAHIFRIYKGMRKEQDFDYFM